MALALVLFVPGVFAEADPETDRGIRPGLPYRVEGLDQVNVFNGTVTLNIPIGPTYAVNSTLSYGLIASYGTNPWDTADYEVFDPDSVRGFSYYYKYPAKRQNAGLGWMVTFGQLFYDDENSTLHYMSPDGGEHKLYASLHGEEHGGAYYTRDGTYLRYKANATGGQIEFPNGNVHKFDSSGRLIRMEDSYANWVNVEYKTRGQLDPQDLFPQSTVWVITDSVRDPQGVGNKAHRVYFRPGWTYLEEWQQTRSHEMIDHIVLMAFDDPSTPGSDTATYVFNYDAAPTSNPTSSDRTSRRCAGRRPDPSVSNTVYVGILNSISMPHGLTYSMSYDRGDGTTCGPESGNITRLTLPSGGVIDWTYQNYGFRMSRSAANRGIATRTVRQNAAAGAPVLSKTVYELGEVDTVQPYPDLYRTVTVKDGSDKIINASKQYFGGCNDRGCTAWKEYGLPFTRAYSSGNAFLSYETLVPGTDGALQTKRKQYVRYEGDRLLVSIPNQDEAAELNQRVAYEKTLYLDDGNRWSDVTHSEFDGFGHYRKSVYNGNFASTSGGGHGDIRTTFTNYNPAAGIFQLDTSGDILPGFTMLAPAYKWLLNSYDRQWVMEPDAAGNDVYSSSRVCFDTNGFMRLRRVYKNYGLNPAENPADLQAAFTADPDTGNRTLERYWGGSSTTPAPSHNCNVITSGEAYMIEHTWKHGVLESSHFLDASSDAIGAYLTDNDIDQNTGLVKAQRRFRTHGESDGLTTTFTYDLLGRLNETRTARLTTTFGYAFAPPSITTIDSATGGAELRRTTTQMDILGRPTVESRSMPGNSTTTRNTTYNALGWKVAVTEWGATAPTQYTYDAFGRTTQVRLPGQSEADAPVISYTGTSGVQRTTRVRTGGDATTFTYTDSVTNETYDRFARLTSVREPALGGTRPLTKYTYDVGNHLVSVCSNFVSTCGQTRSFVYDNRGLLASETHPENGTTHYADYDARGNLLRRYGNSEYSSDLEFTHDRAGRLTDVSQRLAANDLRPLKHFEFGTSNSGGNYRHGRITDAVRFNWTHNGYRVQVRETYDYLDADGNTSARTTSDHICLVSETEDCRALQLGQLLSGQRVFTQAFTYDALGATKTVSHPECDFSGCTSTSRLTTNTYDNGFLTGVSWTGAGQNSITYHPSGLVKDVAHNNGVTDAQVADPDVPARLKSIVTTGAKQASPQGGCVEPTFSQQPQSQTIASGATATFTVAASGETGQSITYHWYRGVAPSKADPVGGNSTSYTTPALTGGDSYWVEASNSCGAVASVTATVTICTTPQIPTSGAVIGSTITQGQSTPLQVVPTGAAPLTYQWYSVNGSTETPIAGATSQSVSVSPEATTTYRVRVSNACGSAQSQAAVTVLGPPSVPVSVVATFNAGVNGNVVTWAAATSEAGIAAYLVERQPGNLHITVTGATTYTDTAVTPGATYVYTVRSRDNNSMYSAKSAPDIAIVRTFTDDPITSPSPAAGVAIRGVHIGELRQAVDSVRSAAGLLPAWTSYAAATGNVDATDFLDLRNYLNEARELLLVPYVEFTSTVSNNQLVRGSAVIDLRNGVK